MPAPGLPALCWDAATGEGRLAQKQPAELTDTRRLKLRSPMAQGRFSKSRLST
jgi:hypothetical protein